MAPWPPSGSATVLCINKLLLTREAGDIQTEADHKGYVRYRAAVPNIPILYFQHTMVHSLQTAGNLKFEL